VVVQVEVKKAVTKTELQQKTTTTADEPALLPNPSYAPVLQQGMQSFSY